MKSQILNLIIEKSSKHTLLSNALSIALINTAIILPVAAQSNSQDSYLPPEVIPINQSVNYGTTSISGNPTSGNLSTNYSAVNNSSTVMSPVNQLQNYQTPQEARKAIYDMWAKTNISPTANSQSSYNEANNSVNNLSNQNISNIPTAQTQNSGWNTQNTNNPMNTIANNYSNTPTTAPQVQTLGGAPTTDSTNQQHTSNGLGRTFSSASALSSPFFAVGSAGGGMGNLYSGGNVYNTGLFGAGVMNYGLLNGFRF